MARGQVCIERIFAFIVVDPADNTEGIPAFNGPAGPMPMLGADMERIESLRPIAQQFATENDLTISVCVFENRVEVEQITP